MADYHPLITRAVAGLDANTSEARRSLYERARAALVEQLRSATPALSESDITRERLALEEAIRKVEAEEARRGRRPQPASSPPVRTAAPSPKSDEDTAEPAASAPPAEREAAIPAAGAPAVPPTRETVSTPESAPDPVPEEQPSPPPPPEPPAAPPPAAPSQQPPAGATALDEAESARLDDTLRELRGRFTSGADANVVPQWPRVPPPEPRPVDSQAPEPAPPGEAPALPADPEFADADGDGDGDVDVGDLYPDEPLPDVARRRFSGTAVKIVIAIVVLAVIVALAAVGYRERESLVALYHLLQGPPPQATREEAKTPPKIEDRVGSAQPDRLPGAEQGRATGPAAQPPPAVAQRVVLYEEDPSNPAGKRYVGSVIWRTETVSPGPGLAPELAVKADIEIPERQITMTFSMVRNTDPTLPASHTVDVRFNLPPDFPGGGIANVPGVLMKQAEQTRGVPLAGIAVKVTDNVFLIGLSSVDSDVQRNTQLLKERTWFDIPIVYSNGSRAILAMEKGTPGERAFNDAFTAWGRSGTAAR